MSGTYRCGECRSGGEEGARLLLLVLRYRRDEPSCTRDMCREMGWCAVLLGLEETRQQFCLPRRRWFSPLANGSGSCCSVAATPTPLLGEGRTGGGDIGYKRQRSPRWCLGGGSGGGGGGYVAPSSPHPSTGTTSLVAGSRWPREWRRTTSSPEEATTF